MLLVAHGVPDLRMHTEVFVSQLFERHSSVPEILEIALKMPSLRKKALTILGELLPEHNPKILMVAIRCPSAPVFFS